MMQLIYFSSGKISDFESHPPVMDWTRRFDVALKEKGRGMHHASLSVFHLLLCGFLKNSIISQFNGIYPKSSHPSSKRVMVQTLEETKTTQFNSQLLLHFITQMG